MIDKLQPICFHPVVEKKIRLQCEYKLDYKINRINSKVIIILRLDLDELLDNPIRNSVFEKLKDIYSNIKVSKTVTRDKGK